MLALLTRLVGGALAPILGRLSAFGASLLRKLALFVAAALCFVVALIALTVAFDLWIASMAGPIVGALAVAGVYLAVGAIAVVLALRGDAAATQATTDTASPAAEEVHRERTSQIDQFIAPLLAILQQLGLRREQLAVLAGASVAKQLRPLPLVGIAIIAGFLLGRMWSGWNALFSTDLVAALLAMIGRTRQSSEQNQSAEPEDIAA